jgi:hypothetical protein
VPVCDMKRYFGVFSGHGAQTESSEGTRSKSAFLVPKRALLRSCCLLPDFIAEEMWFLQIRRGAVALVFDESGWDVFLQWAHPCRLHLVPILKNF